MGMWQDLWSGRAPNSTEPQKELKWPKSDSKVTQADRPQSDLKVTQKWLRTLFLSHFWVTFESLGVTLRWDLGVTFESLLGHFNSFCGSVELGARPLLKTRWGLKGCLASLPRYLPFPNFSPFGCLFDLVHWPRAAPGKSRKRKRKAFFLRYLRVCLPPSPKLLQVNSFPEFMWWSFARISGFGYYLCNSVSANLPYPGFSEPFGIFAKSAQESLKNCDFDSLKRGGRRLASVRGFSLFSKSWAQMCLLAWHQAHFARNHYRHSWCLLWRGKGLHLVQYLCRTRTEKALHDRHIAAR